MSNQVLHGGIAIIKVRGQVVGLMRDVRISDSFQRADIRGLGTILPQEAPVTQWSGSLTCSFYMIDYRKTGIPGAVRRDVGISNAASQVANGINTSNFEDNLTLDDIGVQIDLYKKIADAGSPDPNTGLIIPTSEPLATVTRCFIESENINISEGVVSGKDQSFRYLDPIVYNP